MNFKELKNSAKNTVYGKREPFALAMILYIFLCLILMTPFTIFCFETKDVSAESIPIFSLIIFYFVFLAFVAIIPPLFIMAYIKTIRQLDLSKNSEAPQKITFRSFLDNIKDSFYGIGNFWWTYLWLYLWALATLLPFALISTICMAPSIRSGEDLNIFVFIILIILYFALLSVIINRAIAYSMNWFVLAENSKIGPIEAMKKSKLLTKGHKWELFVLDLSFFGWFLLIYLTFGIILFWVTPYYTMTKYYAFKALLEEYEKTTNEPINLSGTDETYSGTDDNPYFANDLPKTNEPEEKS